MANSSNNTEESCDNGGAIALKGYNYQNAVACLIAIQNYHKENFLLYIEAKEDIELDIEDKHAFIQVKSQNLTLNELLKTSKKNKNSSIFSKNISKKHPKPLYQIVLLGLKSDQNDVKKASDNIIFSDEYVYSEDQKVKIVSKLKELNFSEETINNKIPYCRLYFTPFKDNQNDGFQFLIGCMCDNNIKVDEKGKIILSELMLMINKKAEIIVKDTKDIERKTISSQYLKKLFETNIVYEQKKELIKYLLDIGVIQFADKIFIEKELVSINTIHKYSYKLLYNHLGNFDINMDTKELFEMLYIQAKKILPNEPKRTIFALLIELFFDKIGDSIR